MFLFQTKPPNVTPFQIFFKILEFFLKKLKKNFFKISLSCVFYAHVCLCTTFVPGALGGPTRASAHLRLGDTNYCEGTMWRTGNKPRSSGRGPLNGRDLSLALKVVLNGSAVYTHVHTHTYTYIFVSHFFVFLSVQRSA